MPGLCFQILDQGSATYPGYDQAVKLRVTAIRINYLHDAVVDLVAYLKGYSRSHLGAVPH